MKILVTGASGQLGSTLKKVLQLEDKLNVTFKSSTELDITDNNAVYLALTTSKYDYCINCAAYTHVDLAETKINKAMSVNCEGPRNLALNCQLSSTTLIHISTDFVFDGCANVPYKEEDIARPLNFYGDSKYKGEQAVINNLAEHFILRTSWLYAEFGNNFMKTMIRLGAERKELVVIYDQVSTPTYAKDLAKTILQIIKADSKAYGIYHYSNRGVASWYDFAKAIFDLSHLNINLKPVVSAQYPNPALRPKYSVLDTSKIQETFHLNIPYWRDSLREALNTFLDIKV